MQRLFTLACLGHIVLSRNVPFLLGGAPMNVPMPRSHIRSMQPLQFVSKLLDDMQVDISFNDDNTPPMSAPEPEPQVAVDPLPYYDNNMNDAATDFFNYDIDESPSSMFSSFFQPFFSQFGGGNLFSAMPAPQPMYLHVNDASSSSSSPSVFVLERTNKVNGNTFRYTMRSNGDEKQVWTESWSSPKMVLCNNEACDDGGMQMKDIFNNFDRSFGNHYMHLIPTPAAEVEEVEPAMVFEEEEPVDMVYEEPVEEETYSMPLMQYGMNMMHDCHHKMRNWYYGYDESEPQEEAPQIVDDWQMPQDKPRRNKKHISGTIIVLDNEDELRQEQEMQQNSDDVMMFGMSCVMMMLAMCGLWYVVLRFCFHCMKGKDKKKCSNDYVAMHETDQYQ